MSTGGGSPKRRYWIGYVVGGAVFVLGAVIAVAVAVSGFLGIVDRVDALQRVPASEAGAAVTLARPGPYTIYYEGPGVNEGVVDVPRITMEPVDGAAPVTLRDYSSDFSYDFGGHEGHAVATFRLDRPGRYRLRASGGGSDAGELAVGRAIGEGAGRSFARAAAIGITGLLVGGGIAVWTAIRTYRANIAAPSR